MYEDTPGQIVDHTVSSQRGRSPRERQGFLKYAYGDLS